VKSLGPRIALAVVVSLLTLELGLQVASWIARSHQASQALASAEADEVVILCVGDSHTWGAGVERDASYPAQLETALRARYPRRRIRVENLGVPGVNSAYVVRRLERQLIELQPDLVLVWVGANNFWNELEVEGGDVAPGLHRALLHSKLYRLGTVLWHTSVASSDVADSQMEAERDPQKGVRAAARAGWMRRGRPRVSGARREQLLLADMRRMVETSSTFATPILFLTYPQDPEPPISKLIARFARKLGVPVVVTSEDRERARSDGLRNVQLFVFAAGSHPAKALYGYIVDSLQGPVGELLGLTTVRQGERPRGLPRG